MSFVQSVNNTPATGAEAMYLLKELLKTAGWSVRSSSDGTTYNSSGDQISGAAAGAGGMANSFAWFRIRHPVGAGGRELVFQRDTASNATWRIKYSYTAGFTGGTPGATRVPSATDEQVIIGGGTDASPTTDTIFGGADGTYRCHIRADNATPYAFFLVCYPSGGGVTNSAVCYDPMLAGTYPAEDVDPVIFYMTGANVLNATGFASESTGPVAYLKKGLAGEGFVVISAMMLKSGTGTVVPEATGTNPHNGNDEGFPVVYARRAAATAPNGYKGISSLIRWNGSVRASGSTFDTKNRISVGQVSLPWDGSTTPTV